MNPQLRKRLLIATIAIVVVVIGVVFFVGSQSSAKDVSIAAAKQSAGTNQKVQVQGIIVDNSYEISGRNVTFAIYDTEDAAAGKLDVVFEGTISSTFGNGVTAICTGTVDANGVMQASELVTKCPSKYEESSSSLTVSQLLGYGESIYNKVVKVSGVVKAGSLTQENSQKSFVLCESSSENSVKVLTTAALSENISDGTNVVVTGSLDSTGEFRATEVNLGK